MQIKLSAIDLKILRLLQHNADLSAAEVAERVELSQSPCWRRIHRLQEEGLIERKVALLNPKKLGLNVVVFVNVRLSGHGRRHLTEFEEAITDYPEVIECYTMAGTWTTCSRWSPTISTATNVFCAITCCRNHTYRKPTPISP